MIVLHSLAFPESIDHLNILTVPSNLRNLELEGMASQSQKDPILITPPASVHSIDKQGGPFCPHELALGLEAESLSQDATRSTYTLCSVLYKVLPHTDHKHVT